MDLVTGALGSVLPKLTKLLKAEYKLNREMGEKINTLIRDLESMHAALRKVAQVPTNELDEQVKLWARDVRELSYNVEDILDTNLVRLQGRKGKDPNMKWYEHAINKVLEVFSQAKARHEIAGMIETINEKAKEVTTRHGRYRAQDIVAKPAATNTVDPRLKLTYKEVAQLVGIDKSTTELISVLSSSPRKDGVSNMKLKIVSIVGFGGLGKTTVAQVVYDKLKPQYDCWAFIPVGQKGDIMKVFRDILIGLDKKKYMNVSMKILDERQLRDELRDFLKGKRYLIVIDDVWEINLWEDICSAFVEDNNGSRIIITTRKVEIALEANEVYKLEPLSDDNSKRLFYTRIFGGEEKCPDDSMKEVSNTILKKCGGVPLAIITMSSLLLGKTKEKWLEVCNSPGFYRNKEDRHMENTMHILALSYYDLPAHLKPCLLYLCVYPEDYHIDKASLIWKWVAEGFVEKKPGIGLFQVGEEYFHALVNTNMIKEVVLEEDVEMEDDCEYGDQVYGCHVHDMVLDLIISKSHEEIFVSDESTLSKSGARRLAQKDRTLDLTPDNILPQLRSFIACGCRIDKLAFHQRFDLLRVLALERCYFEDWHGLEQIGNLLHLRYLGIQDTYLEKLPENIGSLEYLQTLDLKNTYLDELPSSIGMLTQLICLRAWKISAPDGKIGNLKSLEELQIYPPNNTRQFVKDLGNLLELRVLRTSTYRMDQSINADLLQSLGNLNKIQHLTLVGERFDIEYDNVWDSAVLPKHLQHLLLQSIDFSKLPSCINHQCLPILCHLELSVETMDDHGLKTLGKLPKLCYLRLSTSSTVTITNIVSYFKKLRFCAFRQSMVQFVLNEDLSVSMTIWNGEDYMAFGTKMNDDFRVGPAIMPDLEEIEFMVHVDALMHNKGSCYDLGLECLPSIQIVRVVFWCEDAFAYDVENQEAALRHALEVHPNRPALEIDLWEGFSMKRGSGDKEVNEVSSTHLKSMFVEPLKMARGGGGEGKESSQVTGKATERRNQDILMEGQQKMSAGRLQGQLTHQIELHNAMSWEAFEMVDALKTDVNLSADTKYKVERFIRQMETTTGRVQHELLPLREDTPPVHERNRNRLTEDTAVMERALEILTVEYPRLSAMLDRLRYASNSLQGTVASHEVINLYIDVYDTEANNITTDFGLGNHSTLEGIKAHIDCALCFPKEVEEVVTKLRRAVDIRHPNNPPTLEIIRYHEDKMVNSNSQLLQRQKWRAGRLWEQITYQMELHNAMSREADGMGELITDFNLSDARHKVQHFHEQFSAMDRLVQHKLLLVQNQTHIQDGDLNGVTEDNAALQQALEMLIVKYPLFVAMLDELKYELSLQGAMPIPQVINLNIRVRDIKVENLVLGLGLIEKISPLQGIKAHLICDLCFLTEVEEVEAELRQAIDIHHPNNPPTLDIIRYSEDKMVNSDSYSQMLERQKWRRTRLWGQIKRQMELHDLMNHQAVGMGVFKTNLNLGDDAKHKVQQFRQHLCDTYGRVKHELLRVDENITDDDLKNVTEEIDNMERALEILAVGNPLSVAMRDEMRAAFSMRKKWRRKNREQQAALPDREGEESLVESITHRLRIQHL